MSLKVSKFLIDGPLLLQPQYFLDDRGYFVESFNSRSFAEATGLDVQFVQDNESVSSVGVLRGLHFQHPPFAQGKLVRVVSGKIFDVAVDIRPNSPTFGRHVSATLTSDLGEQFWIPDGFAHGFVALETDSKVLYKTTDYYDPSHDAGVFWDDSHLAIDWPMRAELIISAKDKSLPRLAELDLFAAS